MREPNIVVGLKVTRNRLKLQIDNLTDAIKIAEQRSTVLALSRKIVQLGDELMETERQLDLIYTAIAQKSNGIMEESPAEYA